MKRRYIVNSDGPYPRPFRVIDLQKRAILIQTCDQAIASQLADEYERSWQERPRRFERLRKFISRIATSLTRRRNTHERSA